MIRLVDAYGSDWHCEILYKLLAERPPEANISHKAMPSMEEHRAFLSGRPYEAWYLIEATPPRGVVGSIYLTKQREVGIFLFENAQGQGYGGLAIAELRRLHPGRLLANVSPANYRSIMFFKGIGAKHIQNTYEL